MKNDNLQETAWAFVLEALNDDEMVFCRALCKSDVQFSAWVDAAREELAETTAQIEPVLPSKKANALFDESLLFEGPFAQWVKSLAQMADLSRPLMRKLLEATAEAARWEEGPSPNVTLFHLDGGPATNGAVVGFVKIPPGACFEEHRHAGEETSFIMQGTLRCSSGIEVTAGEVMVMPTGSTHIVTNVGDDDVIFLVVVFEGVTIHGSFIGPGDPRL